MFLKVSQSYHVVVTLASPKPSQMEAKGVAVLQRGCSVTVPRKAVAPLRAGQPALTAWKKSAEGRVAAGGTSREHHGGLTPAKARTVPNRMVWVNGHSCQRAYFYRYYAAVAEMLVALRSPRSGRPDVHYVHLCLF